MRKKTSILLFIFTITSILCAAEQSGILQYSDLDIRIRTYGTNVISLDFGPPITYGLELSPDIYIDYTEVRSNSETTLWGGVSSSITMDSYDAGEYSLDVWGGVDSISYLSGSLHFPLGLAIDSYAECPMEGSVDGVLNIPEFYVSLDVRTVWGRMINQKYLTQARQLVDYLHIAVQDDRLFDIASLIAGRETNYINPGANGEKLFVEELSRLLGLPGREYDVFEAFEKLSVNRDIYSGTRVDVGLHSYFYNDWSSSLQARLSLHYAGSLGNYIWYHIQPELRGNVGRINESGISFYDDIPIGGVELILDTEIYWFMQPGLTFEINPWVYISDIFNNQAYYYMTFISWVGLDVDIADRLTWSLDAQVDLYPYMAFDVYRFTLDWELL